MVQLDHLSVCETTLVKKLEQCCKYIWVSLVHLRLFEREIMDKSHFNEVSMSCHLIKENHSLGVRLESLGQLTAILMAHIAWWTSDQLCCFVLFLID